MRERTLGAVLTHGWEEMDRPEEAQDGAFPLKICEGRRPQVISTGGIQILGDREDRLNEAPMLRQVGWDKDKRKGCAH